MPRPPVPSGPEGCKPRNRHLTCPIKVVELLAHNYGTCIKTNLAPLRGWAFTGDWLPRKAPCGCRSTSTFIAAPELGNSASALSESFHPAAAANSRSTISPPCARRSGTGASTSSFFRPTAPTRLGRSSPSSSSGCGEPGRDSAKRSGEAAETPPKNQARGLRD